MEQILLNGLITGAQYALIALGLTLIFSLMSILNFAHGQMYVLGAFVTYYVYGKLGLPFIVAIIASGLTLALIGAIFEKYLFNTVLKRSVREESSMLLAAGTAFFLDALILIVFGEKQRSVPALVDGVFFGEDYGLDLIIPLNRVVIGLIAVVLIVSFILFMQYSKPGRAMRALAQDKTAAQLMGVDLDKYSLIGFALGAMLAGVAGSLLVTVTGVNSGIGGGISIQAFTMIMIGGAGVISGAILGGFILGLVEAFGLYYLPGDVTYLTIFVCLMIFLTLRPQGLMGKPWGWFVKDKKFISYVVVALIVLLIVIPSVLVLAGRNDYLYGITSVAILAMISAGVWLTFYMGRINIGQGAYALIGAYTAAVLVTSVGLSFWLSLILAGVVAAFFSILIGLPILRLKGVYFSMITLTLTEVARLLAIALVPITNGPRGITNIPLPGELSIFGLTIIPDFATMQNTKVGFYYLAVIAMIITFAIMYRLVNSRMGILLRSLQQNEELASSFGVNISFLRVISYAISSFFGGVGGAIFINLTQSVYPTTFQVADSINYMLYTFLGGLAYVFGPILGAFVLYFSWDMLFIFKEYQLLIYSGIMILLMLFLPNGILSLRFKKWEKEF